MTYRRELLDDLEANPPTGADHDIEKVTPVEPAGSGRSLFVFVNRFAISQWLPCKQVETCSRARSFPH